MQIQGGRISPAWKGRLSQRPNGGGFDCDYSANTTGNAHKQAQFITPVSTLPTYPPLLCPTDITSPPKEGRYDHPHCHLMLLLLKELLKVSCMSWLKK